MSTLKADTIQSTGGGAATLTKQSAAKAWVSFDAYTSISVSESFGVSSIDDDATGDFGVNLSSAMSASTYAVQGTLDGSPYDNRALTSATGTKTSSAFDVVTLNANTGGLLDFNNNYYLVHGDLA